MFWTTGKGETSWETRAARKIRIRVRDSTLKNWNKSQKTSLINSQKESRDINHGVKIGTIALPDWSARKAKQLPTGRVYYSPAFFMFSTVNSPFFLALACCGPGVLTQDGIRIERVRTGRIFLQTAMLQPRWKCSTSNGNRQACIPQELDDEHFTRKPWLHAIKEYALSGLV